MDNYIYDYDFFDQYEEDYLIPKSINNQDDVDQSNYDPFLDYNPNHIPSYYDENDEYDYLLEEPEAEAPIKANSKGKEKNVFNFHRINWEEIFKRPMSRYDLTKLIQAKHNPHVKSYNQLPYLTSLTKIQQCYQHILPFHEAVLQLFHSKPFKNIPLSPLLTKLTDNDHPQSYFLQYIPYLLEELRANVEQTVSSGYLSSGKMSFDLFPISLTSLQSTSSSMNPLNGKGNHSSYSDTSSSSAEILLCKFYFWTYEDLLPSSDHSFMNEIIHLSIPTKAKTTTPSTSNQKKPEPSDTLDIFGIAVRRSYDQHICHDIQKRIQKQNQNKSQKSLLIPKDSQETNLLLPSQELNNKKSNKRKYSNQEQEIDLLQENKEKHKEQDKEKEKEKEKIILEITLISSQGKLLEEYLSLHSEKVVITWLCGLTPIERMYHSCLQPLPTSFHLQDQLLYAEIPSWDLNTSHISEGTDQKLFELPDRPLNPIQQQVIRSLLPSSTNKKEDSGVMLTGIKVLIGPPGTGKTTTAITWLLNYIQLFPSQRILVTSSSNQAIHILVSQITPYLTSTSTIAWLGIQKNIPTSLMNVHIHEYLHYLLQDIQQTQKKLLLNFISNNINNNHSNQHKQPQNRVLVSILTSFQEYFQQLSQKLSQLLHDKGLLSKKRFQQRLKQQQSTNSSEMLTSDYISHKLHERKTMIRFLKTLIKQINRLIHQCNQLVLSMVSTLNNSPVGINSNNKQIPEENVEENVEESSFDTQIKQFNQYLQLIITHIQNKEGLIESYLLQRAHIVFSTLITSGRPWLTKQIDSFDLIIIDEASQALIPEIFIPLRFNPYGLILIGDPQQLPATILSTHNKQKYFENSLMHWLIKEHEISYQMLTHQYRMHPNICHFISQQYYLNQLITPACVQQRLCILQANARLCLLYQQILLPQLLATSLFIDVSQGQEYKGYKLPSYSMNKSFLQSTQQTSKQTSKQPTYLHTDPPSSSSSSSSHVSIYNEEEAHAILKIVLFLIQHCHFSISQIGILSFYTAQIQYIQHLYDQHIAPILYQQTSPKPMLSYQDWQRCHRLEIKTVDGYQGGEKDIILISMVRTNKSIGFLSDSRRLNVALSRSKYARWIIGNYTQLSDCLCEDIQVLCQEHQVKSDQYIDYLEFETQITKLLH